MRSKLKNIIACLILFHSSIAFSEDASYACSLISSNGVPQSTLKFTLSAKEPNSMHIDFSHTNLFQDLFIHRKDNHEFIGTKVSSGSVELSVYDIQEDDPKYQVVSSNVSSGIYTSTLLSLKQIFKDSPFKRYESPITDALNVAVINNQYVENLVFSRTPLKYKVTFEDNSLSYVFVLDQWFEVNGKLSHLAKYSYPCEKL